MSRDLDDKHANSADPHSALVFSLLNCFDLWVSAEENLKTENTKHALAQNS